jgi:hypothetical protein
LLHIGRLYCSLFSCSQTAIARSEKACALHNSTNASLILRFLLRVRRIITHRDLADLAEAAIAKQLRALGSFLAVANRATVHVIVVADGKLLISLHVLRGDQEKHEWGNLIDLDHAVGIGGMVDTRSILVDSIERLIDINTVRIIGDPEAVGEVLSQDDILELGVWVSNVDIFDTLWSLDRLVGNHILDAEAAVV